MALLSHAGWENFGPVAALEWRRGDVKRAARALFHEVSNETRDHSPFMPAAAEDLTNAVTSHRYNEVSCSIAGYRRQVDTIVPVNGL